MYGMVLMAALTTADVTPDFGHRCGCCGGCWGCYGGGWGCCGCCGGCYGGYSCGCYGGGYGGCYGCWGGYSLWSGCGGCMGGYGGCMGCMGCMGGYGGCMGCMGGYGGCMGGCIGGCVGGCGGGIGYGYDVGAGIGAGVGVGGGVTGPYVPGATGTTPGTGTGTPPGTGTDTEGLDRPKDSRPKKSGDTTMVPTKAQLVVEVPADAKLYIDDQAMKTPTGKRTFNTPRLQPDQTYYYILRAEVERDGKTVAKTRRVLIRAGEVVRASFSDLGAEQSVAQAK